MRVVFWTSDKQREHLTADAVRRAVEAAGDGFAERCKATYDGPALDADVVCAIGVKSKRIFDEARAIGQQVLLFDKAIVYPAGAGRDWSAWKVSLNGLFPTAYMMRWADRPQRWRALRRDVLEPREARPEHVVAYVASSGKHLAWHGVDDPRSLATKVCKKLQKLTGRRVVYRPKPSDDEQAMPLRSRLAGYSPPDQPFKELLDRCCLIAVVGSNASVEALADGVAVACLGANVANPVVGVADSSLFAKVRCPSVKARVPWLNAVAWCQWGADEMPQMWDEMKQLMLEPIKEPPPWMGELPSAMLAAQDA